MIRVLEKDRGPVWEELRKEVPPNTFTESVVRGEAAGNFCLLGDSYREKRVGPTASKAMRVRNRGMKRCELAKEQWERVKAVFPLSHIVRRRIWKT